jgi:macrolide-specific efflux system membrane fusion protein
VPVEVGLNNKIRAEIISGLSEGDEVVTGTAVVAPSASQSNTGTTRVRL